MDSTRSRGTPDRTEGEQVVVRGCPLDTTVGRSVLTTFESPRIGWADGTTTIAARGAASLITAAGPDRFLSVRQQARTVFDSLRLLDELPVGARPRFYGGFAFTDTREQSPDDGPWRGFPSARFVLPAIQFSLTADGAWLTAASTGPHAEATATARLREWRDRIEALPELAVGNSPGTCDRVYTPSKPAWREQVEAVISRIRAEQLRKVVLAQSLTVSLSRPVTVADVLARLGESYPGCYRFLFETETGSSFFGATPERLVSRHGTRVETEAVAGSIGRGETRAEDEWLATQLRESDKNAHEHELVVEAILAQLDSLTTDIETGPRIVRKLANVQHLQTPIRGTLTEQRHVLELVEALHPTPAVGGLPPEQALDTIRETETFDRGWYAAPVGWFDADGNGSFAVAIRSGVTQESSATLFAGAGIVPESDPDSEYDEIQLKYRPVLDELS